MDFRNSRDKLLHMIYTKQLPTMRGGGIDVPISCPAHLRKLWNLGNASPLSVIKHLMLSRDFPFQVLRQRGVTKGQIKFPPNMTWEDFVGDFYTPNSVGSYAFIPKAVPVEGEVYDWSHNITWLTDGVLVPYAHLYLPPKPLQQSQQM